MPFESSDEIRNRVVALIARHSGVPVESVDLDTSIWDTFPPNEGRGEHPAVTSFVRDLHDTYDVYLTEEELEEPTPSLLAEHIATKLQNPAASEADWKHFLAQREKGRRWMFAVVNLVFAPMVLLGARGDWTRRLIVTVGLVALMNALVEVMWRLDSRRVRAARSNRVNAGR